MQSERTEEPVQESVGTNVEVETSSGVLATLGLNPKQFGYQLFNFLVVLVIVWFLILKPLNKKLEERKKIIDESLDRAKEIESKMTMATATYQEKIAEAMLVADGVIARAHTEAKDMAEKMKGDTKKEIGVLVSQAREKIQAEKETTILELRNETIALATAIAEKILEEKIDGKKDKQLIESAMKGMNK